MASYNKRFYERIEQGSVKSAEVVLPIVFETLKPKTLLDVGCGNGSWLSVAKKLGVTRVQGVDGPWVDKAQLLIGEDEFAPIDFERPGSAVGETYDMAMTLEVLEHVTDAAGKRIIEFMAKVAPVLVVSAAIPGQGGRNHINERWPSYWAGELAKYGYEPWDLVRHRIWRNEAVKPWYRQNLIVYVHPRAGLARPKLPDTPMDIVNPDLFAARVAKLEKYKMAAEGTVVGRIRNAVRGLRKNTG